MTRQPIWKLVRFISSFKRASRLRQLKYQRRLRRLTDRQIMDICDDAMASCEFVPEGVLREYRRRLDINERRRARRRADTVR